MAKGGRTYTRDARGRFASSGGGASAKGSRKKAAAKKPEVTGGTLAARTSLRKSRAKMEDSPTGQQRGAVLRGNRKLTATIASSKRSGITKANVIQGGIARKAKAQANRNRTEAGVKAYDAANKRGAKFEARMSAYDRGKKQFGEKMAKRFAASGTSKKGKAKRR